MKRYDIIIIGSGPAGLMATIQIENNSVLLLDASKELGGKMLVSGGGRCNITNKKSLSEIMENIPKNNKFLYSTLTNFSALEIIDFFENNNVALKEEDHNRIFPQTNKSRTFVEVFEKKINKQKNIDYQLNYLVEEIEKGEEIFIINNQYKASKVVIATGGVTYPHLSFGNIGHQLVSKLGHTCTELKPAETPLISNDQLIQEKSLQGITLENVTVEILINNKKKTIFSGHNLLFTHFGLSGPIALRSSYIIKEALDKQKVCQMKIKVNTSKIVPKKIIPFLNEQGDLIINIDDTKGFNTAFVTNGGISLREVNAQNFESKIVPNLYIIGEILDINAYTGGYNITTCLSEGYTLGRYLNRN